MDFGKNKKCVTNCTSGIKAMPNYNQPVISNGNLFTSLGDGNNMDNMHKYFKNQNNIYCLICPKCFNCSKPDQNYCFYCGELLIRTDFRYLDKISQRSNLLNCNASNQLNNSNYCFQNFAVSHFFSKNMKILEHSKPNFQTHITWNGCSSSAPDHVNSLENIYDKHLIGSQRDECNFRLNNARTTYDPAINVFFDGFQYCDYKTENHQSDDVKLSNSYEESSNFINYLDFVSNETYNCSRVSESRQRCISGPSRDVNPNVHRPYCFKSNGLSSYLTYESLMKLSEPVKSDYINHEVENKDRLNVNYDHLAVLNSHLFYSPNHLCFSQGRNNFALNKSHSISSDKELEDSLVNFNQADYLSYLMNIPSDEMHLQNAYSTFNTSLNNELQRCKWNSHNVWSAQDPALLKKK